MKAAFTTRVNLVTQVAEATNFPAGQESLELKEKPVKKLLASSASEGTKQRKWALKKSKRMAVFTFCFSIFTSFSCEDWLESLLAYFFKQLI